MEKKIPLLYSGRVRVCLEFSFFRVQGLGFWTWGLGEAFRVSKV